MMAKRSLRFIAQIKENLVRSTKNFPETLFLGYVIVVLMILINRNDIEMEEPLGKVLLSLFAILPLSAVLSRMEKRFRLKAKLHFGLYFVMVVLDVLFYLNLPEELNEGFFVRFNIWMLIVSSLFFLIPFLFRKDYFEVFFLKNVAIFFMTVLYIGILILGIYGIIALLEYLFEMNFNSDIYADVAVAVSGFFGLTFFLGKQKIVFEEEAEEDMQYPNLFRVLFSGIVIPLLLIYSFILYAYFLRLLLL
ncbi:MAG: DUF4153 domain-containing protein, partial [Vallitaleaceae bacterium]|nr:DUF4153 domain-containing protein [Vallitaleaceae bacterium]